MYYVYFLRNNFLFKTNVAKIQSIEILDLEVHPNFIFLQSQLEF